GGNQGGTLVTVARGDDLVKEIRSLLVQGQVTQFIDDQQCWLGIELEFANQRVIDLRSQQVIEHVHSGGEQHSMIGLTCAPTHDFGEKSFTHARITDENGTNSFWQKLQVKQPQDAMLGFHASFMVLEIEAVNGRLGVQTRQSEAALDGA